MRPDHLARALSAVHVRDDIAAALREANARRVQTYDNAFALENVLDRGRHVVVLAMDEPLRHLDDGDFAAETSEHLPEFETDVAAADDDQVPGKEVEVHHRAVVEVFDLLETRQPRHGGAAADVDEDPLRREPVRA